MGFCPRVIAVIAFLCESGFIRRLHDVIPALGKLTAHTIIVVLVTEKVSEHAAITTLRSAFAKAARIAFFPNSFGTVTALNAVGVPRKGSLGRCMIACVQREGAICSAVGRGIIVTIGKAGCAISRRRTTVPRVSLRLAEERSWLLMTHEGNAERKGGNCHSRKHEYSSLPQNPRDATVEAHNFWMRADAAIGSNGIAWQRRLQLQTGEERALYFRPMILLLNGASDVGRAVIIERLMNELPNFRHIDIAELTALPFLEFGETEEKEKLSVGIACHCAKEMREEEGFHIVLSHPNISPHMGTLREELGDELITIHLGGIPEEDESIFDYVLDTANRSASDVHTFLMKIVTKA